MDLQSEARGGLSTDSLAESPDREKLDPRLNPLQSILDSPPDKTAVRHPGTKDTTKKTLAKDLFTGPQKNLWKKASTANAPDCFHPGCPCSIHSLRRNGPVLPQCSSIRQQRVSKVGEQEHFPRKKPRFQGLKGSS